MKTPLLLRSPLPLRVGRLAVLVFAAGWLGGQAAVPAAGPATPPPWLDRPLSLEECLNIAFDQNGEVRKSRKDIEAAHGVSIQTRAIVIPKVQVSGDYSIVEESAVDNLVVPPTALFPEGIPVIDPGPQRWAVGVRLVQSIYEGGRMASSLRTARLLREQALAQHQAVLADTATDVRVSYCNVLLGEREITVSEASVDLLQKELEDSRRRFDAGTVPRFNVLRAEVELANARPRVSRARNAYRIAKTQLVNLLGYNVPGDIWEDIPLRLSGSLDAPRIELGVPRAVALALERRPELVALRKAEELRREGVVTARSGYLPRLQGYVGYGARKSNFGSDVGDEVHGWEAGVQASWSVFDGALTRGRVAEARALLEKTEVESDNLTRRIELEVRVTYSTLVEAWEVMESQKKVVEQAEEALRLARARADAGTGTQLDVLGAQTALTEARTTDVRARREYAVALARLERAIGAFVPEVDPSGVPKPASAP
jgi:outer membrane protein TolC